jgi:hypothetical protein
LGCALDASGQPTAEPPSSVMNSRRCIGHPICRIWVSLTRLGLQGNGPFRGVANGAFAACKESVRGPMLARRNLRSCVWTKLRPN